MDGSWTEEETTRRHQGQLKNLMTSNYWEVDLSSATFQGFRAAAEALLSSYLFLFFFMMSNPNWCKGCNKSRCQVLVSGANLRNWSSEEVYQEAKNVPNLKHVAKVPSSKPCFAHFGSHESASVFYYPHKDGAFLWALAKEPTSKNDEIRAQLYQGVF